MTKHIVLTYVEPQCNCMPYGPTSHFVLTSIGDYATTSHLFSAAAAPLYMRNLVGGVAVILHFAITGHAHSSHIGLRYSIDCRPHGSCSCAVLMHTYERVPGTPSAIRLLSDSLSALLMGLSRSSTSLSLIQMLLMASARIILSYMLVGVA